VIQQEWCVCGNLEALIDAKGQRTSWERDVQGRITREVRADGATDMLYTYDATGRVKTITDPKDQVTTHTYLADDSLSGTTYTNAVIATPGVSFTYDPVYPRVTAMADGSGTTTYAYKTPGQLGAGMLATVDGPLPNDLIAHTYDELGRVTSRSINGAANTVTWAFDAMDRVTSEVNLLGTFTYAYDGVTSRIATVTYPNGQTSLYSYLPTTLEHRLQTIHHKYPSGATLSKFDYTYDVTGNITTWQQQVDSDPAVMWSYLYDNANQLTAAIKQSTGGTPTTLKRYAYGYDPVGNRTFEQIDDEVTAATHDNLNRLLTHVPGGPLQFRGTVNEPASVTIQGAPAVVDSANTFRGVSSLPSGTGTVSIVATDPSGNQATKQYELNVTGGAKTLTYDANGNLTSDGVRSFEWDAANRLVAVTFQANRTEFAYDGEQRRVGIVEKQNGSVQSAMKVLWCGTEICEERSSDGTVPQRRVFALGEQRPGALRYTVTDHLRSASAVLDESGIVTSRFMYDPSGRVTVTGEPEAAGFTGHRWQNNGALWLALYRAYDSDIGRWLTEDPFGLNGGLNLYQYANGRPIGAVDRLGLVAMDVAEPVIHWVKASQVPSPRDGKPKCGFTRSNASFRGDCDGGCGIFFAHLRIRYRPEIFVATDTPTPKEDILEHEMGHHRDNLAAIARAKQKGEKLERRPFPSYDTCIAAINLWAANAAVDMGSSGLWHNFWEKFSNPCKI
jgi:RHS repeat-associated protein